MTPSPRLARMPSEYRVGFRRGVAHGKRDAQDEARAAQRALWTAAPLWRRLLHALDGDLP